MMFPPFPFFRPPMYYNSYRNPYYNNFNRTEMKPEVNTQQSQDDFSDTKENRQTKFLPPMQDEQYFDIFGIRLYFDDILILCLLFFLYEENVNDQLLFMALLLLLLS